MCDVVERIRDEVRVQGRAEGQENAREEMILNLLESNAGSIEQIAAWVKLPVKEVKRIAQKVTVHV